MAEWCSGNKRGVWGLWNCYVEVIQTAMEESLVCHPVDWKILKKYELKHPSHPKNRDTLEDALTLTDVCGN